MAGRQGSHVCPDIWALPRQGGPEGVLPKGNTQPRCPVEALGLSPSDMDPLQKLCAEAGRHVQDDGGLTGASFFEQGYVMQLQQAVKDALQAGVNPMSLHRLVSDTAFKHLEEEPNLWLNSTLEDTLLKGRYVSVVEAATCKQRLLDGLACQAATKYASLGNLDKPRCAPRDSIGQPNRLAGGSHLLNAIEGNLVTLPAMVDKLPTLTHINKLCLEFAAALLSMDPNTLRDGSTPLHYVLSIRHPPSLGGDGQFGSGALEDPTVTLSDFLR